MIVLYGLTLGPILQPVVNAIAKIGDLVLVALVTAGNLLIAAVGGLIGVLFLLLPDMPTAPTVDGGHALGYAAWLFPVGTGLALLASFTAAYVLFLVIRIGLRWAKAS